jgi:hypothetical protein
VKKPYRIQPRIDEQTFKDFQKLAEQEKTNMSRLARRLIREYIAKSQKTPV